MLGAILGGAGDAINLASGLVGLLGAKKRKEEQYAREDTAVQRRAADMEAAGFSKTLAAGSAAQATAPIRAEGTAKVGAYQDARNAQQAIKQSVAQTELIGRQSDQVTKLIELQTTTIEELQQRIDLINPANIESTKASTLQTRANTLKTFADTKRIGVEIPNIIEDTANKKETGNLIRQQIEKLNLDIDEKRMLNDQLGKDLFYFMLFNQPYTKTLFSGGIPSITAQLASGALKTLNDLGQQGLQWLESKTPELQALVGKGGAALQEGKRQILEAYKNTANWTAETNRAISNFLNDYLPGGKK